MVPGARAVRSLWALLDGKNVEGARECLRAREGARKQAHIGGWSRGDPEPASIAGISEWAHARKIDAVVWTALPPKFKKTNGRLPSEEEVITHLRELPGAKRDVAECYVRRAPRQIDTRYRRRIEAELHWLPEGMQETPPGWRG